MKSIIIKESNRDRLEAALHEVNGRAQRHAITDLAELEDIASMATTTRLQPLTQAEQRGAEVDYLPPGGVEASSYGGYRVVTTRVRLRRQASGWALVGAEKEEQSPSGAEQMELLISPAQRDRLIERTLSKFTIRGEEA